VPASTWRMDSREAEAAEPGGRHYDLGMLSRDDGLWLTRFLLPALLLSLTACGGAPGSEGDDQTSDGGTLADGGSGSDGGTRADGGSGSDGSSGVDGGSSSDGGTRTDGGTRLDGGTGSDAGTNPPLSNFRSSIITYYDATGGGNCSFPPSPLDLKVVALTQANLYESGKNCGACIEVEGPLGRVVVRVTDSCPECGPDHLDLSLSAFALVANPIDGIVPTRWRYVACNVVGPVQYHVKEGSSQYWTAVQVRNHRLPIAKLEWLKNGAWVSLPREHYNYFVEAGGMGTGPIRIRITATDGQVLEDTLPSSQPDRVYSGIGQFAPPP
jgi:expansin (peptidoglycan-binding protein)